MTDQRRKIVAILMHPKTNWILVILPTILLFGPMLISGRSLFWGTPILQFIPWRDFAIETIKNGHFPLWNPWLGMGAPLIANYQSAVFYPPNWMHLFVGNAWGNGLSVLLHLIWAGLGMRLLARKLNLGVFAQTLAGISFSLSSYLVSRASFLSIINTAAWLPWILLAADGIIDDSAPHGLNRKSIKSTLLLVIPLALQWLAGHAQTSWYTLLLAIGWVTWFSVRRAGLRGLLRAAASFSVALLLAFAISAVQLLPTLEYLIHSQRSSDLNPEAALSYSFWPWRFLSFLMPNLFGNPATGNYWGYANFWEDAVYIGLLPILLAMLAVFRGFRDQKYSKLIQPLFLGTLFSFTFALGKNTPIFPFLFENVPTFDLFLAPTRWSLLAVFCLSLLAALGAELWLKKELVPIFWVRLGTVGAAAISVVALLSSMILQNLEATFVPAIATAGIWMTIIGVLAWRRRLRPDAAWPLVASVLLAIDLLFAGIGLNPTLENSFFEGKSDLKTIVNDEHRMYMPTEIEHDLKFDKTHRFDTFFPQVDWVEVRNAGLPNVAMLDEIAAANNFDPLLSRWYTNWIEQLEMAPPEQYSAMLSLMDVGWLVMEGENPPFGIEYAQLEAPQRVHFFGNTRWVENEKDAIKEVFLDKSAALETLILIGDGDAQSVVPFAGGEFDIIGDDNPNNVMIEVSSDGGGWMLLSDQWYPGWVVSIDDNEEEILRANYLFRGVKLSPGDHIVEFEYKPASFKIGGWISLIAIMFVGLSLWFARKI